MKQEGEKIDYERDREPLICSSLLHSIIFFLSFFFCSHHLRWRPFTCREKHSAIPSAMSEMLYLC